MTGPLSPYERVLGERMTELHPRLQTYFRGIPPGSEGVGEGVLDVLGTGHAWLRPVLALLGRAHVTTGSRCRDVPFRVVNRPATTRAGRVYEYAGPFRYGLRRPAGDGEGER